MPVKRYEVLLPVRYNDGTRIEDEKFQQSWSELMSRFGAMTLELQPLRGRWTHGGIVYEDELVRFVVDVEDTPQARSFFAGWKHILKTRFAQVDVWITGWTIDVV